MSRFNHSGRLECHKYVSIDTSNLNSGISLAIKGCLLKHIRCEKENAGYHLVQKYMFVLFINSCKPGAIGGTISIKSQTR